MYQKLFQIVFPLRRIIFWPASGEKKRKKFFDNRNELHRMNHHFTKTKRKKSYWIMQYCNYQHELDGNFTLVSRITTHWMTAPPLFGTGTPSRNAPLHNPVIVLGNNEITAFIAVRSSILKLSNGSRADFYNSDRITCKMQCSPALFRVLLDSSIFVWLLTIPHPTPPPPHRIVTKFTENF